MLPGPVTRSTFATDVLDPVREHGDRLGAADRVHLLDAEQVTQGQDVGVRQSVELDLRRRGDGDRGDPGDLGGDHVHDHAGGECGQTARDVQTDPVDRDHPLA